MLDESGKITLTDFGVAGPPREKEINIEGSPSYLAPEIIYGGAVDYRADIYSLGVTAFHMLSGSLPFSAPTLPDLLRIQSRQEAPDVTATCPEIDEALASFINDALKKDRDERISQWDRIQTILAPQTRADCATADTDETRLIIRLQNSSSSKTRQVLDALHKLLALGLVKKSGDRLNALSIKEGIRILDQRWDNYFVPEN